MFRPANLNMTSLENIWREEDFGTGYDLLRRIGLGYNISQISIWQSKVDFRLETLVVMCGELVGTFLSITTERRR